MEQKEVLLIIPAYNEEKNIGKVMDQLAPPEIAKLVDVLVMNDASSDNTIWMVKQRGYAVITHVFNLGYGSGLQLGYKYAIRRGYRYVIQMDADGQHDVCNIRKIYEKLKEIADTGLTMLIVEQDVNRSLKSSDYAYVVLEGKIVMQGQSKELSVDEVNDAYFGINTFSH